MTETANPVPGTDISLGVTLYSLTNEWAAGNYTLASLVQQVAERGIGPGVEVVGFQTIRNFPHVDNQFVRDWRALVDQFEVTPSCLGINTDVALRRDRMLSDDELVEYLAAQIRVAHKLGFPIVRTQLGGTTDIYPKLLRQVEHLGIKIGMEIHSPEGPNTELVLRTREAYEKLGSPLLGFIPDFSSTMRDIPHAEIESYVAMGLPPASINDLRRIWRRDDPQYVRINEFSALAREMGATEASLDAVQLAFTMHGHEPIDGWLDIMPQVVHVHGKFYEIDAEGQDPSIDIPGIIKIFVEAGYKGYISSEWEGHAFRDIGDVDPLDLIEKQHLLIRQTIANEVASQ